MRLAGHRVLSSADLPQSDRLAVTRALHHGFLTMGALTLLSSLTFWTLRPSDGESVSRAKVEPQAGAG